uniref:Uncharacterized protein n=1 Tax=Anopheles farauti TaxID=69004 RepID=A0A182QB94_9DIPT
MDGWKKCLPAVLAALVLVCSQLPPVGSNATETRPRSGGRDRSSAGSTAIASLSSASIVAALASRQTNGNSNGNSGNGSAAGGVGSGSGPVKCNIAQLRCANGTCIPSSKFCDGNFDCLDKSDEPKSCTGERTHRNPASRPAKDADYPPSAKNELSVGKAQKKKALDGKQRQCERKVPILPRVWWVRKKCGQFLLVAVLGPHPVTSPGIWKSLLACIRNKRHNFLSIVSFPGRTLSEKCIIFMAETGRKPSKVVRRFGVEGAGLKPVLGHFSLR